ncbi:MAG: arginine--tRNA ligase [Armatimonadota bacterium]|jgi:arginyl-tRNA synthetase
MPERALRRAIAEATAACADDGICEAAEAEAVRLERPPRAEMGDFAANTAMALAGAAKMKPRELAQAIIERLELPEGLVERVEIAGPGFINFHLSNQWLYDALAAVLRQDAQYGRSTIAAGKRANVEFVSANPVGPIHIGNARGGPLGDVIASLLEAIGYDVEREYYINDAEDNTQLIKFGASVRARYLQALGRAADVPEDGYHGEYVAEYAELLAERHGEEYADSDEPDVFFADLVMPDVLEGLRRDCGDLGIEFDTWFSERKLRSSDEVDTVLAALAERGETYERDEATWLRTTAHEDDEDRVLVRRTGAPTYLATDVAYHADKYGRGHDLLIDIWGPDHHGRIIPMRAAVECLGYAERDFELIMHQTVRLISGGEVVRMSKRGGTMVSLRDIMDAVGPEVARYLLLTRSADAHIDFDLEVARKQSDENPVYYVQYAHTRMCGIFRTAAEADAPSGDLAAADLSVLQHEDELALLRLLADFPGYVEAAAVARAPHRLTTFAQSLAQQFHQFYGSCRVLSEDAALTAARLALVKGTQIVMRNALGLLGVSAPEQM